MDSRERIFGAVADLISDREVLINKGEEDGVEVGMRFAILFDRTIDIKDPHTGEFLGPSPQLPKTIVKIVRVVGPHLSVGRTFRTIRGRPGIADLIGGGTTDTVERIEPAITTLRERISEGDYTVHVGDRVMSTAGEEFYDL